jgi:hypothetical protein
VRRAALALSVAAAAACLAPSALAPAAALTAGGADGGRAARGAAAVPVRCPLAPGSPHGGDVQWAFTQTGAPAGAHPGTASSYTHGRGSWTRGRATGTICHEDMPAPAGAARDLVLAVTGTARLAPGIVRSGLPGVRLALGVTVTASDDPSCPAHARGTVTLFASYHAVHRDAVILRFPGGCAGHDHTYASAQVHVLIARGGRQVNSA